MENLRITSGYLRGRVIRSPKSNLTHPMGAREKLALFNMIADELPGALVLDAFAGSGALGIEALSRGAREAILIEKNPKIAQTIVENLKNLGVDERAKVFVGDVANFKTDERFEIIIADPPYDNFEISKVVHLTELLKNDGIFILSHPEGLPEIEGLKLRKTRKYARARISIYSRET